jgi:hypothetical protein
MNSMLMVAVILGGVFGALAVLLDGKPPAKQTHDELQAFRDGCEYERNRILALLPDHPAWIRKHIERKIRDPEGTDHE